MPSGLTVSIPVKIYIREYFQNLYGHPCRFPKMHHINGAIALRLSKPPLGYIPKATPDTDLEVSLVYNDTINVLYNTYLSNIAKDKIRGDLRNIFYTRFHSFINERINKGMQIKESVWEFIRYYQLSADVYDTLAKKAVRRFGEDKRLAPKKHVSCAGQKSDGSVTGEKKRAKKHVSCAGQKSWRRVRCLKNNSKNNVSCAGQKSVQLSIF